LKSPLDGTQICAPLKKGPKRAELSFHGLPLLVPEQTFEKLSFIEFVPEQKSSRLMKPLGHGAAHKIEGYGLPEAKGG
jgi:hypothetical protein